MDRRKIYAYFIWTAFFYLLALCFFGGFLIWYLVGTSAHYENMDREINQLLQDNPNVTMSIQPGQVATASLFVPQENEALSQAFFFHRSIHKKFVFPVYNSFRQLAVFIQKNPTTYEVGDFNFYFSTGHLPNASDFWSGSGEPIDNTEWILIARVPLVVDARSAIPKFSTAFMKLELSEAGITKAENNKHTPNLLNIVLRTELENVGGNADGWFTAPVFFGGLAVFGILFVIILGVAMVLTAVSHRKRAQFYESELATVPPSLASYEDLRDDSWTSRLFNASASFNSTPEISSTASAAPSALEIVNNERTALLPEPVVVAAPSKSSIMTSFRPSTPPSSFISPKPSLPGPFENLRKVTLTSSNNDSSSSSSSLRSSSDRLSSSSSSPR